MIQEYLLQALNEKNAIASYNPGNVQKRIFSVADGKSWFVQYSVEGCSEEIAKRLSEIDEHIQTNFKVTVLEHGCSSYFNKKLYPLISRFERELRKLLYLISSINQDEKTASNIKNLETKDFGEIFSLLFIDTQFMETVKEGIKKKGKEFFSKAEVIASIESIEENTLWDSLLGKETVPTLRKQYNSVRESRNAVMHSHYIRWNNFKEIRTLYRTINNELDMAIRDIDVRESLFFHKPAFNQTLADAFQAHERYMKEIGSSFEIARQLTESYRIGAAIKEASEIMNNVPSVFKMLPELQRFSGLSRQLTEASQRNSVFLELREKCEQMMQQISNQQSENKEI